jgi:hypothetical protein
VHPGSWDDLKAALDRFLKEDFNDAHTIRKAHRELLGTEFFSSLGVRVR